MCLPLLDGSASDCKSASLRRLVINAAHGNRHAENLFNRGADDGQFPCRRRRSGMAGLSPADAIRSRQCVDRRTTLRSLPFRPCTRSYGRQIGSGFGRSRFEDFSGVHATIPHVAAGCSSGDNDAGCAGVTPRVRTTGHRGSPHALSGRSVDSRPASSRCGDDQSAAWEGVVSFDWVCRLSWSEGRTLR